jgi:oxalate decarboxylase/phosphoglucose isomerase-like protein (cupin superfamily)
LPRPNYADESGEVHPPEDEEWDEMIDGIADDLLQQQRGD